MTHTIALIITTLTVTITDMDITGEAITATAITAMDSIASDITIGGIRGLIGASPRLAQPCRDLDFTVGDIQDCIGKRAAV